MFGKVLPVLLLSLIIRTSAWAETERITAGDPVEKVYETLGTPTIEFPLNGQLIQQYEQCTVFSRNGIVSSVEYKQIEDETTEKATKDKSSPSLRDVITRAENGDPEAQYLLAYSLQFGQAVEQDYVKAVEWYTKAALQGHMPSQHNLGWLYMRGKGVSQNYQEAYVWALLAAGNGNNTLMNAIHDELTQEQRQAAELRAAQLLSGPDRMPPDSSRSESLPLPKS